MKDKRKKQPAEELPEEQKAPEETPDAPEAAETENSDAQKPDSGAEEQGESPLEAQLLAEKDRYLRLAAEYDNFRRRSQKERENIYADIRADTVLKFLPVYDNLERALSHETADEAYRRGVELIMTGFTETLEKLGVTAIPCVGESFDPELHNAVLHEEDETKGENEIVEELQKGFKLGDKVIRFSMVKVAN